MATSNRRFVRVPADGNGKRIAAKTVLYVDYSSATQEFYKGATVTGGTSSVRGTVLDIIIFTGTTGQIVVNLDETYFNSVFTTGENLIVDSDVYAVAASAGDEVYFNEMVLVSGDNPTHRQIVNERGAQLTTFADGTPRLDAFGRLKVSYPTVIGTYDLFYSASLDKFHQHITAGANLTYLPSQSAAVLSVDGISGSAVSLTNNKYHTYVPGTAMSVIQTVVVGDAGKQNNFRRWGYFDDSNGIFWELSGSTVNVVVRSNATGMVEETRIPQASWSNDRFDGSEDSTTNLSGILLDITKNNIYTIDFQWLGAGRINFGIVDGTGELVVAHQVRNANTLSVPWMSDANLPLRYQNINTSATSGTSELKMVCASVQADIPNYDDQLPRTALGISGPTKLISSSTELTHYFAGRSGKYRDGKPNRAISTLTSMKAYAAAPMLVEIVRDATLTAPVWTTPYTDSSAELDVSASNNVSGSVVFASIIDGAAVLDISETFKGYNGETFHTPSDFAHDAVNFSLRARLLSGSTPAQLTVTANWREYR